jgi:2-amino-4-hydroxy-6-hydroxymethyldihydropteridine diphosphokinase
MMQLERAAVALGANLGDREKTLEEAGRAIVEDVFQQASLSPVYESTSWPDPSQPKFLNLVVVGETDWNPEAILNYALDLERAYGRRRGEKNAPRTLDVDLLLHGEAPYRSPRLEVPHPRLASRDFVLFPLADVAGDWNVPGLGSVRTLADRLRAAPPTGAVPVAAARRHGLAVRPQRS